jgi:hypothetical protein
MKRPIFFIAFLMANLGLFAQNLVNNPGMEAYSGCPTGPCQWNRATGWYNPNGTTGCSAAGSPDYYHTCGSGVSHLPNSGIFNLNPHSGNAVMGFLTWSGSLGPNYREYVGTYLNSPMVPGQNYTVSFWICNAYNPYYGGGSNRICLDFSNSAHFLPAGVISLVPEIEIPTVFFSNAWVNFTFSLSATSNWTWITFGNFYTDANTTAQLFDPAAAYYRAYYFIDDVEVFASVVFPLDMGDPKVIAAPIGSQVSWEATAEEGITEFVLERTLGPGHEYIELDRQAPKQPMGQRQSYAFHDASLRPGQWYYRLKALDREGNTSYSKTTEFTYWPQEPIVFNLAPNMVNPGQPMQLSLWSPGADIMNIQMVDVKGVLAKSWQLALQAGEQQIQIETAGLARGTYILRMGNAKQLRFGVL